MRTKLDNTLLWVHRANIRRYRRLLQTELTGKEREFIERRIEEEEEALLEITRKTALVDCPISMP